jgi:hypothetical protein
MYGIRALILFIAYICGDIVMDIDMEVDVDTTRVWICI